MSNDPPRSPQKSRRAIVIAAATAIAVVALLVLGAAYVASSRTVVAMLDYAVERCGGRFAYEGARGSVFGTMHLDRLHFRDGTTRVVAEDVEIALSPRALLESRLVLPRVAARRVEVELPPGEARDTPVPASLALPLPVDVGGILIERVDWKAGSRQGTLDRVSLSYAGDADGHRVRDLDVRAPGATLTGAIEIGASPPFTVGGSARLMLDAPHPQGRIDATLGGNLVALDIDARGKVIDIAATARARLAPFAAEPLVEARAGANAIDLAQFGSGWPATELDVTVTATPGARRLHGNDRSDQCRARAARCLARAHRRGARASDARRRRAGARGTRREVRRRRVGQRQRLDRRGHRKKPLATRDPQPRPGSDPRRARAHAARRLARCRRAAGRPGAAGRRAPGRPAARVRRALRRPRDRRLAARPRGAGRGGHGQRPHRARRGEDLLDRRAHETLRSLPLRPVSRRRTRRHRDRSRHARAARDRGRGRRGPGKPARRTSSAGSCTGTSDAHGRRRARRRRDARHDDAARGRRLWPARRPTRDRAGVEATGGVVRPCFRVPHPRSRARSTGVRPSRPPIAASRSRSPPRARGSRWVPTTPSPRSPSTAPRSSPHRSCPRASMRSPWTRSRSPPPARARLPEPWPARADASPAARRRTRCRSMRRPNTDASRAASRAHSRWRRGASSWRGRVESLAVRDAGGIAPLALAAPVAIDVAANRVSVGPAKFDSGGAQLEIDKLEWSGGALATRGRFRGLPLAPLVRQAGLESGWRSDLTLGGAWDVTSAPDWRGTVRIAREGGDVYVDDPGGEARVADRARVRHARRRCTPRRSPPDRHGRAPREAGGQHARRFRGERAGGRPASVHRVRAADRLGARAPALARLTAAVARRHRAHAGPGDRRSRRRRRARQARARRAARRLRAAARHAAVRHQLARRPAAHRQRARGACARGIRDRRRQRALRRERHDRAAARRRRRRRWLAHRMARRGLPGAQSTGHARGRRRRGYARRRGPAPRGARRAQGRRGQLRVPVGRGHDARRRHRRRRAPAAPRARSPPTSRSATCRSSSTWRSTSGATCASPARASTRASPGVSS